MKMIFGAVLAVAAVIAAPASAAELVTNGNFETGSFAPWSTTGNVAIGSVPYFGLSSANYGRFIATFNGGDSAPNGTLSQTVGTALGTIYNFAFDYGVTSGGSQSIVASVLDGTTMALLSSQTFTTASQTPVRGMLNFTARSGSAIIRFSDVASNSTAGQDIAVDNVSVSGAVPEPATWAMMMLGFGGMGYAMRRRATVRTRIRFA